MKDIYLVGAARTPIGRFGGALAGVSAAELGAVAAKAALGRAGLSAEAIQEVVWGCARQAGAGPNVARQIGYRAGAPETVPAFTVNQACGSGL
ncbi:MAG: acetyl-CoA C-acyltransferase, partial [Pyrinomonadaceae bacterium]